MANIHGKGAILYLSSGGGTAINVGEQIDWSLDFDMATVETTPLNNTWKTFVKGLMGYTGAFSGNFDTASTHLFGASTSTVVEKWYLYPLGTAGTTQYYYGTAWVQLTKVAAGSTTAKASSGFKLTGHGSLNAN